MAFNQYAKSIASQIADRMAAQAPPGFSQDAEFYRLPFVEISGASFDPDSKRYSPELDADGVKIGMKTYTGEGASALILGGFAGVRETRLTKPATSVKDHGQPYAYWKQEPPGTFDVKGTGGGLKTPQGGWVSRTGEVILLIDGVLCVHNLWDNVKELIGGFNKAGVALGVSELFQIQWRLKKTVTQVSDTISRVEPTFTIEAVRGDGTGLFNEAAYPWRRVSGRSSCEA
jgi:hypothetical protein